MLRGLGAGIRFDDVRAGLRRKVDRCWQRRGLRQDWLLGAVHWFVVPDEHAQGLLGPRDRRSRGVHQRFVRRQLLRRPHLVEAVTDASGEACVREVVVGLRRVARAEGRFEHALLREDRQVRVTGRYRDDAARVVRARPRHVDVVLRVRPGRPGARGDERNRQGGRERSLALGVDDHACRYPVVVQTVVRRSARQRRDGLRARLLEQRLSAADLLAGDLVGRVSRQGEADRLVHAQVAQLSGSRGEARGGDGKANEREAQ